MNESDEFESQVCEQCGDGLMRFAGSRRYEQEGEQHIQFRFRCASCGYTETIDARVAQTAEDPA